MCFRQSVFTDDIYHNQPAVEENVFVARQDLYIIRQCLLYNEDYVLALNIVNSRPKDWRTRDYSYCRYCLHSIYEMQHRSSHQLQIVNSSMVYAIQVHKVNLILYIFNLLFLSPQPQNNHHMIQVNTQCHATAITEINLPSPARDTCENGKGCWRTDEKPEIYSSS